jgi:S1-C subfamily serine protease
MPLPLRFPSVLAGLGLALVLSSSLVAAEEKPATPAIAPALAAASGDSAVENSVVKIFTTMRYPDLGKPWTKQAPREATGSGVVIEGKRILTNAHLALYASQVQVQANQSGDKLSATVEFVAAGIDLAVLKLDDESFFDTHKALPRAAKLPAIKDAILVYGFPTGGTSLSITKGIVSRVEFTSYNYPTSGLRVQIDAAINPGNSGGPALVADQMVGLAFSRLGGGDNIGYIIPAEEIEIFLRDIADGRYDGKPAMFDELQTLENPALRAFLKLDKTAEGMVVHEPAGTDANYLLKEWDLITRIGTTPIDVQGMINAGDNLRVRFNYLIQKIAVDGKVPITVVRAGRELKLDLPLITTPAQVIADLQGAYPAYFVCGPLVFSPATAQLVSSFGGNSNVLAVLSAVGSPLVTRRSDHPEFPGEELVVVSSPLFPHKLAKGYSNPVAQVVKAINHTPVKNLKHLVEILRDSKDEFLTFTFDQRGAETLVFPRQAMIAATEEILTDNGVRSQASPELLAVWNAKPTP